MTTGNTTSLNMLAAIANINRNQRMQSAMAYAAATGRAPIPAALRMIQPPLHGIALAPRPGLPLKKRVLSEMSSSSQSARPVTKKAKTSSSSPTVTKPAVVAETSSPVAAPPSSPLKPTKPTPTQYLKQLFEEHKLDASKLPEKPVRANFVKPAKTETESYDAAARLVRVNDLEQLRAFHKEGKNLDACNKTGESLLMIACRRGHVAIADFLLNDVGVRWDLQDDFGRTVLHDACWRPSPSIELMEVLFRVVSPKWLLAPDVRGHTPFDYARREHAGVWYDYLKEREEEIKRKIAAASVSAESSLSSS